MIVLICGGRSFEDGDFLYSELDRLHAEQPFTAVIHGAARGADTLAGQWAASRDILVQSYRADWKRYGNRAAGPIRNRRMLDEGMPDLVIAFPGGRGTRDMIEQAHACGVDVLIIEKKD